MPATLDAGHYEINDGMIYVFSVIVYEADKRVRCRMNC